MPKQSGKNPRISLYLLGLFTARETTPSAASLFEGNLYLFIGTKCEKLKE
jgi:hypothetical protein